MGRSQQSLPIYNQILAALPRKTFEFLAPNLEIVSLVAVVSFIGVGEMVHGNEIKREVTESGKVSVVESVLLSPAAEDCVPYQYPTCITISFNN